MNDYYVYEHIRNDNNSCFYVGKGHGKRAYSKSRNEHHNRIARKCGMTVNIVKENLSEEEAFKLEHELICDYVFNKGGASLTLYNTLRDIMVFVPAALTYLFIKLMLYLILRNERAIQKPTF